MSDGTECLICEQGKDCESSDDLALCCTDCREEVAFLVAEMRRMRWERD